MTDVAESLSPVSDIQLDQLKIEWVERSEIKPNKYNPNRMTWHDRQLLKTSLLEDGWTQPIVSLPDGVIVDGEQRWTIAGAEVSPEEVQEMIDKMTERVAEGHPVSESILWRLNESKTRLEEAIERGDKPTLAAITGGLVPRTTLDLGDDAHKMISTIRHNRARGTHQIDAMAGITSDLMQLGLDLDDLEGRLGMDDEEVSRFMEMQMRDSETIMADLDGYGEAWEPTHLADLPDDDPIKSQIEASTQAAKEQKAYQTELASRGNLIDKETDERVAKLEKDGKPLTQEQRDNIRDKVESEIPEVDAPDIPTLKKLLIFVTPDEYKLVADVLGQTSMATELVLLCEWAKAQGYAQSETGAKAN